MLVAIIIVAVVFAIESVVARHHWGKREQALTEQLTVLEEELQVLEHKVDQMFKHLTLRVATIAEIQQRAGSRKQRLMELFHLLQEEMTDRQTLTNEVAQRKKGNGQS
jgi:hypothetical protein